MKVLQINVVYNTGSTGKITACIHNELKKREIESLVIYGRNSMEIDAGVEKSAPEAIMKLQSLQAKITGNAYGGCYISTMRTIKMIEKAKPDVVHLQCLNGYFINIYRLLEYLKQKNISTVLTLHAEFMYTANCGHAYECEAWKSGCGICDKNNSERPVSWFFDRSNRNWEQMRHAYEGFYNLKVVAVSEWLKGRAIQSPFFKGKDINVIYNGVDTELFYNRETTNLKKRLGITDERILLYITPDFDSPLKGGKYILELSDSMQRENVIILIVGRNIPEELPENVRAFSFMDSQEKLAEFYSMADACVLTSKRETFSMVCAEAFCCGTPVVGFEAGGPENMALEEYSSFVPYGEIESLKKAVQKMLEREIDKKDIEKKASTVYSKEKMVEQYIQLYKTMIEEQENEAK